jgi:hypothetical protein
MLEQRPILDHIIVILLVADLRQGIIYHIVVNVQLIRKKVYIEQQAQPK